MLILLAALPHSAPCGRCKRACRMFPCALVRFPVTATEEIQCLDTNDAITYRLVVGGRVLHAAFPLLVFALAGLRVLVLSPATDPDRDRCCRAEIGARGHGRDVTR